MPANKYLSSNGGSLKEVAFNQTSAGAADAGKGIALNPQGQVDLTMMPTGIGPDTATIITSEALAAGAWVNIWNNAGAFNVRNADATVDGKYCHGFVLAAVAQGASALVYMVGVNNQITGMTPGDVYLQTTAGTGGPTPPTGSGNIQQRIGVALSATAVSFERGMSVVLA